MSLRKILKSNGKQTKSLRGKIKVKEKRGSKIVKLNLYTYIIYKLFLMIRVKFTTNEIKTTN